MNQRSVDLAAEVDRLRAERDAALARAARYAAAIDAAPVCLWSTCGETGRYEFVNPAFADLFGRSTDEALKADPFEDWVACTHPDDIEAERQAIARLAACEIDRFQLEKRVIAKGREPRWHRVQVVAERGPSGRLERIFGCFVDVHDRHAADAARREAEAQLQQTQKLDALGKLAGGIAHDFNNRLLIIIGYAELIRRDLSPESALVEQLDLVLASAQRGAELTRQLLAYSRQQVLKPEAFDVNATVDHMRVLLGRVMGEQIELQTELAARSTVFCDPGQIEQVILNLAINARDAMPRGGRLTLATRDRVVGADEAPALAPGDYVALAVTDTGTGIADELIPHIFEPFFTTKEVGRGTGLGLSMVDGIVQQSGGAVTVRSRLGEGTTFTVFLPHGSEPLAPHYAAVDAAPRDIFIRTVLVCDDDEDVRRLLVDVLRLRAHAVLHASSGARALEVAACHDGPIDLLITDLVMPGMGGIELATELRQRRPALRVLYVSGYTEDTATLSEPLGPHTRFLAKPFLPGDLTRAVFSILEEPPTSAVASTAAT
jgi:PAS domain S-box-containing protein